MSAMHCPIRILLFPLRSIYFNGVRRVTFPNLVSILDSVAPHGSARIGMGVAVWWQCMSRLTRQGSQRGGGVFEFAHTGRTKKDMSISDTGRG